MWLIWLLIGICVVIYCFLDDSRNVVIELRKENQTISADAFVKRLRSSIDIGDYITLFFLWPICALFYLLGYCSNASGWTVKKVVMAFIKVLEMTIRDKK